MHCVDAGLILARENELTRGAIALQELRIRQLALLVGERAALVVFFLLVGFLFVRLFLLGNARCLRRVGADRRCRLEIE
jgi:hypothetical protein